jgi:hypothetical protein
MNDPIFALTPACPACEQTTNVVTKITYDTSGSEPRRDVDGYECRACGHAWKFEADWA